MKRILLSISTLLVLGAGTVNAQWVRNPTTGTSTGMSFTGGTAATTNIGSWGGYTPAFTDATCTTYAGQYFGGAGANSGAPKDSTNQVAYTMATIATGGDNNGAGQGVAGYTASPSFSVATNNGTGTTLDLSASANRKLSIRIRSTVAFTADLLLLDNGYQPINTNSPRPKINILGDNTFHVYSINFDTSIVTASINSVFNISFIYDNATPLSGRIFISDFAIGSATPLTTGTQSAAALVASSKLYPNPVSDLAKVELNLKSSSAVKIILSDMMGKEVMTIADGTFADVTKEFSVATLNKGIYTVNYYINGEAAKAELLMVK